MNDKLIKDLEAELRTESKTVKEVIRTYVKKEHLVNLMGGVCSRCGESSIEKLEFHHFGEKDFTIGHSKTKRISVLEAEIKKCIILCANCHNKEHHDSVKGNDRSRKRKQLCLDYKNASGCSMCGYNECNRSLDFHHVDRNKKLFTINLIICAIKPGISKGIISPHVKDELDKCIVVCRNCHKSIHFNLDLYNKYKQLIDYRQSRIKETQKPLDRQEVKRLYDSGMTANKIAKYFNASKGTINDILKRFGVTKSLKEIDDIKKDKEIKVLELHRDGKTLTEIIFATELKNNYIREVLRNNGFVPKQENIIVSADGKTRQYVDKRKFNPSKEELEELLKTKSLRDIGNIFGVSRIAVFHRKKKMGL